MHKADSTGHVSPIEVRCKHALKYFTGLGPLIAYQKYQKQNSNNNNIKPTAAGMQENYKATSSRELISVIAHGDSLLWHCCYVQPQEVKETLRCNVPVFGKGKLLPTLGQNTASY